jgi:hypothetical protein
MSLIKDYVKFSEDLDIPKDIDNLLNIFQYLGYNPFEMYKSLLRIAGSEVVLRNDITKIIVFASHRGANIIQHLKRSNAEAKKVLDPIIKKYKIVDSVKDKTEVTAGRIMGAFPHLCSKLAEAGHYRDVVHSKDIKLHPRLRFNSAPSIILDEETYEEWLIWAIETDKVINVKKGPNEENVRKFGRIMFESTIFKQNA